jgi:hypothetical protein
MNQPLARTRIGPKTWFIQILVFHFLKMLYLLKKYKLGSNMGENLNNLIF